MTLWKQGISILVVIGFSAGCGIREKRFNSQLAKGNCDQAMVHLPQRDPMVKLANETEKAARKISSYVFVGASYTAEVLWDVTGLTVMAVAMCAPQIAFSASGSSGAGTCMGGNWEFYNALSSPPLGRQAVKAVRGWQCPDLTAFGKALRSVASCYEAEGTDQSYAKAETTLRAVRDSRKFYSCLPDSERVAVERQLTAVQMRRAN